VVPLYFAYKCLDQLPWSYKVDNTAHIIKSEGCSGANKVFIYSASHQLADS